MDYDGGKIKNISSKINVFLHSIVMTMSSLDEEVTQGKKCLKDGMDSKILLGDALDTCKYSSEDLHTFFELMCDVNHELADIADNLETNLVQ